MTKPFYSKPFLPYTSQLALLKFRGMIFDNDIKLLHLLENIGYHRLSSYWYPLLADKVNYIFKPKSNFETVFNLYKFDRELRKLIIAELEKIEIAVRSKMSYILSIAHSAFWIENETLFINAAQYKAILVKINEDLSRSDNDLIISFKSHYSNTFPPSYMLLEITSFGLLLRLYNNLLPGKLKKGIAAAFGLSDSVFTSWLHSIVYIRNLCAHHERLWNRQLRIQPLFPRKTQQMWLKDITVCNNRIYYVLSIIVYFLNNINPKHTFKQKLESLFIKYPAADRTAMGFPINWHTEPLWQ